MKIRILIPAIVLAALSGCGREMPEVPDGNGIITVAIADTSGSFPGSVEGEPFFLAEASVSLQARTHVFTASSMTESDGAAVFTGLPAGEYSLFARTEIVAGAQKKVFTGYLDMLVGDEVVVSDTLYVSSVIVNALMINEILYCGSDYANFYFYDQFVELYNSSEDTLYLDGIILTRNYPDDFPDMDTNDFVRAIYAFQFPGTPVTGREHPIAPKQYIVIAADAIDHSIWASNATDLSGADWECFNPLGSDYDVPGVPNIVNIMPGRTLDYMINVSHNAVVIATGEEYDFETYGDGSLRLTLPLYTVIDGVEYGSSADITKELTARVDAGWAGIGNSKYSAQSVERREIGVDTNNSIFDFVLTKPVTPGYSHLDTGGVRK